MNNLKLKAMKNLKSLKKYQIQPIEKMSCIKGGKSVATAGGRRMLADGSLLLWSADCRTYHDQGSSTQYHSHAVDRARGFEACAPATAFAAVRMDSFTSIAW